MKAYTSARIEISGYTDDVGSDTSNMVLSRKRAEAVMEYLKNKGVEPEKMTALGFGESPSFFVADNKTPAGRQQNRRVEIISIEK
jgi:outer membrane protein OmpA-like peptidoglycan-associated protein